jgi:hypothetical protein
MKVKEYTVLRSSDGIVQNGPEPFVKKVLDAECSLAEALG